jgi:RNA polymerase sigma factor (sigma-70 family)
MQALYLFPRTPATAPANGRRFKQNLSEKLSHFSFGGHITAGMTTDDMELVRLYAANQSETAFAALVARYLNLVYSVALRRGASPELAEEVAQTVFVILARNAGSLGPKTILSGWLYRTACFVSAAALKRELRRHRREQEAQIEMNACPNEPDSQWERLAPLLDEAMLHLRERDRNALVLRFFQNKSMREVGLALGVEERAAQKRVARSLERLRGFFAARGVASTTAMLSDVIRAHSVQAAPPALAKSITAAAVSMGAGGSGSTLTLIKGALKIMAWTKAKTAVVVGVAAIVAVGTTPVVIHYFRNEYVTGPAVAPKKAAEGYFNAWATKNWDELATFDLAPPSGEHDEAMKEYCGGLEVISIGKPYQPSNYAGWYVPYKVKFRAADINVRVSNTNSAKRYVVNGVYDSKLHPIEELKWAHQPEALANDDVYARMSPADVVKAYYDTCRNGEWVAMGKLAPADYVEESKLEYAQAQKDGDDPHALVPAVDVGEAVWSKEESAWFVKCHMAAKVQKWHLAVRNDNNRDNRYVFDGGF